MGGVQSWMVGETEAKEAEVKVDGKEFDAGNFPGHKSGRHGY